MSVEAARYSAEASRVTPRPAMSPGRFSPADAALWAQSVPGWMTGEELRWLAERAAELKAGDVWVEVGVLQGRSLSAVVLSVPAGVIVDGVDDWTETPPLVVGGRADPVAAYQGWTETERALRGLRCNVPFHVEEMKSAEAARLFEDASLAAVFVDAAHDRASVLADLLAWEPKLRPGGLLCGHDYYEPGVFGALLEYFGSGAWDVVKHGPGSLWYFRKEGEKTVEEQQLIISIRDGVLTLGVTAGMSVADANLWLDLAKKQLLEQGPDAVASPPDGLLSADNIEEALKNGGS